MRARLFLILLVTIGLAPNATDVRSQEILEAQSDPTSLFDMSTP